MISLETVPCPLCQGRALPATHRQGQDRDGTYWRCQSCSTAHLLPQPSPEFLHDFYEQFHRDDGLFAAFEQRTNADFSAKAKLVARTLARAGTRQAARVLDVGCGKGGFVQELARHGFQAEGIDLSSAAIDQGRQQGAAQLHAGPLNQHAGRGRYDAVTAWATLEHVPEPEEFLRTIFDLLKPGGWLFLDTGLAGDAVERWAPGHVQWYDAPQHLYVFSRAAMKKLLAQAGFDVVRLDPNFERNTPRRAVKYLRNRLLAGASGALFRLALGKTGFDRLQQENKLPFGSLMLVAARRKGTK